MTETNAIQERLGQHKIVPVITLHDASLAGPLADALITGGLPVAEVTFRTDAAEESIKSMANRGNMLVGAGTVLTTDQADRAQQAGAQFAVSPGFNPTVVRHCQKIGLPFFPGVSNPTDIEMAIELGLRTVKFFPAEAFGGVSTLKAISAPYPRMQFIPTGGINAENLVRYLSLDMVLACGGSWMVNLEKLANKNFEAVEASIRNAVMVAKTTSGNN